MARYFNDELYGKELYHHGILGQRWGIRRFQNEDGSLTPEGRERYGYDEASIYKSHQLITRKHDFNEVVTSAQKKNPHALAMNKNVAKEYKDSLGSRPKSKSKKNTLGIVLAVGGAVAVSALILASRKKSDSADTRKALTKNILESDGQKSVQSLKLSSDTDSVTQNIKDAFWDYGSVVENRSDENNIDFIGRWVDRQQNGTQLGAMSDDEYSSLNDSDYEWPAGQTFGRISKNNETDVRDLTYLSASEDDINRYRAFLPGFWKASGIDSTGEYYQVNMSAKSGIKSPSDKKRVDIFKELLKNSESFQKNLLGVQLSKNLPEKDYDDLTKQYYKQFAFKLSVKDHPAVKEYCDSVKSLGYNAIVDDNDRGNLSEMPLIVLDNSSIKIDSSEKLTTERIAESYKNLKPVAEYSTDENISRLGDNINGVERGYYVSAYYSGMRKAAGLD